MLNRDAQSPLRFALIALLVGVVFSLPAQAQEQTTLPEVPYYSAQSSATRFNVPIPAGWANQSEANRALFVNGDLNAEIHALALTEPAAALEDDATGREAAIQAAIGTILADAQPDSLSPRHTASVNLSNGLWTYALFSLADGADVTAFAQTRASATYVLLYINRAPGDYFMLAVQPERRDGSFDVQEGIALALAALYPDVGAVEASDTVELSNGTWTRDTYAPLGDLPLVAIGQARADAVYVVVENGAENLIQTANKIFFTTFFGWFVTPYNDEYLVLGLVAVAVIMGALLASMGLRYRNLRKDLAVVQTLRSNE